MNFPFNNFVGQEFELDHLPEDWRGYSGVSVMIFSHDDFNGLGAGVRGAIDQWVLSGGRLLIVGQGLSGDESRGFGAVKRGEINSSDDWAPLEEWLRGSFFESGNEGLDFLDGSLLDQELGSASSKKWLVLLLLILFAVLVGPVNLFILAGRDRRYRLFVTTPLIAVGAGVLMVGLILLMDGFGGRGVRVVVMDTGAPDSNSAAIFQQQFSRSGVLMSSKFELDDATVLFPVGGSYSEFATGDMVASTGAVTGKLEKTSGGWEVTGDFFGSRSERSQILKAVVPNREKVTVIGRSGGDPELVSSFSKELGKVFYRDGSGVMWKVMGLKPGESMVAERIGDGVASDELQPVLGRLGGMARDRVLEMIKRHDSYVGLMEDGGGIETHESIDWDQASKLVMGRTK